MGLINVVIAKIIIILLINLVDLFRCFLSSKAASVGGQFASKHGKLKIHKGRCKNLSVCMQKPKDSLSILILFIPRKNSFHPKGCKREQDLIFMHPATSFDLVHVCF